MNQMQQDVIKKIEVLFKQRLSLLKHYPVLSVSAMQYLENGEVEAFCQILDERDALMGQIDPISSEINALIAQLGENYSMTISAPSGSDMENNCPDWCTTLLGDFMHMQKLLRNCTVLNARLDSRAKVMDSEIREQLNRIHAQRKIYNHYATQNITMRGEHINYLSK